jgi:hypothetical protein
MVRWDLSRESFDVEIFGIDLGGTPQRVMHDLPQRVLDDHGRGCWTLVAMDDQHALGRRGFGGLHNENEQGG